MRQIHIDVDRKAWSLLQERTKNWKQPRNQVNISRFAIRELLYNMTEFPSDAIAYPMEKGNKHIQIKAADQAEEAMWASIIARLPQDMQSHGAMLRIALAQLSEDMGAVL